MANTYDSGDARPDSSESGDEKLLSDAKAFFKLAEDADSDNKRLALEDLEFRAGEQWPESVKADRQRDGRPCLVINRIPQFIQQVTNDQRQNRPSIKVHPVDDTADVETAKVIQGLVRHIEYNSNADVAYDTAFDSAATGGFGYFRVLTEYVNPTSFDQEILIKRIRNPFSVFFDPHSQEPDGSDACEAGIAEDMSADKFKALYPKSKLAGTGEWESAVGNSPPNWLSSKSARVAEYFYKETKEVDLVQLSDGQTVEKSQVEAYTAQASAKAQAQGIPAQPITVVKERKAQVPVIKWCKLNAVEILEKTEWLGKYIPIVPVYGNELYIDGKRILEGIVRNAKDPQRMYNYWASAETEAIALAPRAPFIVAEGQLEGYKAEWEVANKKNHAFLTYKPTDFKGQPLPPPQRNAFEPAVQAITQARGLASEDLKATTGIYDAALGARSNETSGVAIQRRNQQAQTSNFHFIDNLTRSLRHCGRILVDLIPKVYDTARSARIIGEDGEQKIVQLNQPYEEDGKPVLYALDAGQYDVTVDVGPSFATKRQEAVAAMLDVAKAYPQIMQFAGDLFVKGQDWPGAQEIADRLKKTLPPGMAEDPTKKGQEIPPEVQQQMQQMSKMVEQLTAQLHAAHDELDTKKVEIESKERIEMAKLETSATIELAKLESKEGLAVLAHQIAELDQRTEMLKFDQPLEFEDQDQPPQQDFNPEPNGGMPADQGQGLEDPTGGVPPGSPMEGNPHDDPSSF